MTPQQTDDEPKRSTMKKMTTVSRRQAMATIAAAGGLTALSLGGSSSEEEISENLNVGGGPMSDAMSGNVARLYEGPSSDLDDPGIQGRFFKITEDDADTGWSAGTLLEDDGDIWKPVDLGVGSIKAERLNNADRYVTPEDDLSSIVSTEGSDSTIVLLPGTHEAEGVSIPNDGRISFIGFGKQQTTVQAPEAASDPVFVGEQTQERVFGVRFKDMTIKGDEGSVHGIDLSGFEGGLDESQISNVKFELCDNGIRGSGNDREDFVVMECKFQDCEVGHYVVSDHPYYKGTNVFSRCVTGIGGDPFHMPIVGVLFEHCDYGIRGLDGGRVNRCRIKDCRFTFNEKIDIILDPENQLNDCEFNAGKESVEAAIRIDGDNNQINDPNFEQTQDFHYDYLIAANGPDAPSEVQISDIQVADQTTATAVGVIDPDGGSGDLATWNITGGIIRVKDAKAIDLPDQNVPHGVVSGVTIRMGGDIGTDYVVSIPETFFGLAISGNSITIDGDAGGAIEVDGRSGSCIANRCRGGDIIYTSSNSDTVPPESELADLNAISGT